MNRNQKYYLLGLGLFIVSISLLYNVFGKELKSVVSRFLPQVEKPLQLITLGQDSLSASEVAAQLPATLSVSCRAWLQQALAETSDEPRGYFLLLMPRLAQSALATPTELSQNRNVIGVCKAAPMKPLDLRSLDSNLDRILMRFESGDSGSFAETVLEVRRACESEIEGRLLTETVYRIWNQMNPTNKNPCDF